LTKITSQVYLDLYIFLLCGHSASIPAGVFAFWQDRLSACRFSFPLDRPSAKRAKAKKNDTSFALKRILKVSVFARPLSPLESTLMKVYQNK
jgi:hypothetical protein